MRTLFHAALSLCLVSAVANCDRLKKLRGDGAEGGADAEADAAVVTAMDAAVTPPPQETSLADNEDDIARFPDETKLDNVAASLLRPGSVREAPVTGAVVTTLAKGASVTQLAQRDKYFLVVFPDPKNASKKTMGWLHQDAFSAVLSVLDGGVKALTCKAPEIALWSDGPFCGRACTKDTDCATGQACKGSASKLKDGKIGDTTTVCTIFHPHDAGAPKAPAADAGTAGDAGAKADAAADAGTKPILPPLTVDVDVVDPTNNLCPPAFQLVPKDKKCHRVCGFGDGGALCKKKETQNCVKCGVFNVCTADRDICK